MTYGLERLAGPAVKSGIGFITPPPLSGVAGVGLSALGGLAAITAVVDVIGRLGGYQFRDDQLAKINGRVTEPSSGSRSSSPPFTGGQSQGVSYSLVFYRTGGSQNNSQLFPDGSPVYGDARPAWIVRQGTTLSYSYTSAADALSNASGGGFLGAISGVTNDSVISGIRNITVATGSGDVLTQLPDNSGFVFGGESNVKYEYSFVGAIRSDGQTDTGGNPQGLASVPAGYVGDTGIGSPDSLRDSRTRRSPLPSPVGFNPNLLGFGAALGFGVNPSGFRAPDPINPPAPRPNIDPSPTGLKPTPVPTPVRPPTPIPTPVQPPTPNPNPDRRSPFFPTPPNDGSIAGSIASVGQQLAQIGSITALIAANTTPEAQRQNSKNGSCDALNSDPCTKKLKDDIKNPILGNVANVASVANLAVDRIDGVKGFLEKAARAARLDKVYNFLTFITVVHNAQMLSNSLATTLMDSLSLGLATFNIKDENEAPIDIQEIINKSVEDTVKSIIGTANYNTISERWKSAVRVYQSGANIVYQVRSLWDSAKSLNELTGANVGRIGNALRRDGVVSENAYPAMADNPVMVNSAMTRLQNLEEAASHLSSITSETYGITETVAQIKKDQDDFKKLVKESPITNGTDNDAQKAKDTASKAASISPVISNTDLVKPD